MTITISRPQFWTWLCRFAYRRAAKRGKLPVGLPGNRDPESPCAHYFPVKNPSGHGPCESDGHYMCRDCEWLTAERREELFDVSS